MQRWFNKKLCLNFCRCTSAFALFISIVFVNLSLQWHLFVIWMILWLRHKIFCLLLVDTINMNELYRFSFCFHLSVSKILMSKRKRITHWDQGSFYQIVMWKVSSAKSNPNQMASSSSSSNCRFAISEVRPPSKKGMPVVVKFSVYVVDINSINVEDMDFR